MPKAGRSATSARNHSPRVIGWRPSRGFAGDLTAAGSLPSSQRRPEQEGCSACQGSLGRRLVHDLKKVAEFWDKIAQRIKVLEFMRDRA
jgi:hypothetical protein